MTAQGLEKNFWKSKCDTYTRRSAKIDTDSALLQKSIFLVQLNQLEGGTSSVALLFGKPIPFIQTTFTVLRIVSI